MKMPVVVVRLCNGLVSAVEVEERPFQPMADNNSSESTDNAVDPSASALAKDQRRKLSKGKQPTLPLSPSQLPQSQENGTEEYLTILDKDTSPTARFILHDENIPGVRIPRRLPPDSSFITMVEWALRPGDSRVEAYFIGSNKTSKHWYLFQCTVDDLHPWSTRYLKTRNIAMLEKGNLELEEAALLLLECAWRFEREHWGTRSFFLVSNDGLLDEDTVSELGERVWPEEEDNE